MFNNCKSLKKIDISSFNIKNNTKIENIFNGCENLSEILIGDNCLILKDKIKSNINIVIKEKEINKINEKKEKDDYKFYKISKYISK